MRSREEASLELLRMAEAAKVGEVYIPLDVAETILWALEPRMAKRKPRKGKGGGY